VTLTREGRKGASSRESLREEMKQMHDNWMSRYAVAVVALASFAACAPGHRGARRLRKGD
jgi:hypothetical protein